MTAAVYGGPRTWSLDRDRESGNRTYGITHLVKVTDPWNDGPNTVLNAVGLPTIGSVWNFGTDLDLFAYCTPRASVRIHDEQEGDAPEFYRVDQEFTSEPLEKCQDDQVEDPLLEPQKVSGSFVKTTQEAVFDRFGDVVRSSSHELFRGAQVEVDSHRPTVTIEQNVGTLGLSTFSAMINKLNDSTMWGLPARTIKLSDITWTRKVYGSCNYYYTRIFTFDIDFNTFDRNILDEGTKALEGHWDKTTGEWTLDNINGLPPDPTNPTHFDRVKDRRGENMRVMLDGAGKPLTDSDNPKFRETEFYDEDNLLSLGIPTSF